MSIFHCIQASISVMWVTCRKSLHWSLICTHTRPMIKKSWKKRSRGSWITYRLGYCLVSPTWTTRSKTKYMSCSRTWSYIDFLNTNVTAALLLPSKSHANFSCGQPYLEIYRKGAWKNSSSLGSLTQYKATTSHFLSTLPNTSFF